MEATGYAVAVVVGSVRVLVGSNKSGAAGSSKGTGVEIGVAVALLITIIAAVELGMISTLPSSKRRTPADSELEQAARINAVIIKGKSILLRTTHIR